MIRLGVIGCGGRAYGVIRGAMRDVEPELRVVGIVDPNKEKVLERLEDCDKDAVFYDSLDEMVKSANLDGLFIGTRCNLHTQFALEAAKYDIPLFLEKPVAIDMEQATALEKGFENAKCPVVVSFPLRVSPLCVTSKEEISKWSNPVPEHITATNYVNYGCVYWEEPYRDYSITGGLFLQKATHDLDYMMYLMGSPVVRIAAMGNFGRVFGGARKPAGLKCSDCDENGTCYESPEYRKRHNMGWRKEDHLCVFSADCGTKETGTNEDCSSVLVEFASGAHGVYTQVFYAKQKSGRRGAIISGYDGLVDFDWASNKIKTVNHHKAFSSTIEAGDVGSHAGGDSELCYDFIGLIKGNIKKSRTPIETGIQSVYTCLAARESMHKGEFMQVRQVGQA